MKNEQQKDVPSSFAEQLALVYFTHLNAFIVEKTRQSYEFDSFGVKMLLLSNGGALVVCASSLETLLRLAGEESVFALKAALFLYVAGVLLGGVIYLLTWSVVAGAPAHYHNQIIEIITNKRNILNLQGWGIQKKFYQALFRCIMYLSLIFFISATIIIVAII